MIGADPTKEKSKVKSLEQGYARAQDSPKTQSVFGETAHEPTAKPTGTGAKNSRRRRHRKSPAPDQAPPKPENMAFVDKVRELMAARNMRPSDVARRVWGGAIDSRGYHVARGRDRIGEYLAGRALPDPQNLALLAEALDVPVEELEKVMPPEWSNRLTRPTPRPLVGSFTKAASIARNQGEAPTLSAPQNPDHYKAHLTINADLPWELAWKIWRMVKEFQTTGRAEDAEDAEQPDAPVSGSVITGGAGGG